MMHLDWRQHWSRVYETKEISTLSWYQAEAAPSLRALDRFSAQPTAAFIDIGGGASSLIDALVARGWNDLTVLDIAGSALEAAHERLGDAAAKVQWREADITQWRPSRQYDVWHDRAVFHFLTEERQREAYRSALLSGLAPGGLLIIATFAPDGPERCSDLPVRRYDSAMLAEEFGPDLELLDGWSDDHVTPSRKGQPFTWCTFRRAPRPGFRSEELLPSTLAPTS